MSCFFARFWHRGGAAELEGISERDVQSPDRGGMPSVERGEVRWNAEDAEANSKARK